MRNCVVCLDNVDSEGLPYPVWHYEGERYVHKNCLLNKVAELCQDDRYEKILKYIIAYEEENNNGSNKSQATDWSAGVVDCWWDRQHIKLNPQEIRKLLDYKVIAVILPSSKNPSYSLCARETIKQFLQKGDIATNFQGNEIGIEIFSSIVDYDEDKRQFVRAINRVLKGGKPTHFLLEGVPSSGKSTFIDCIAEALGDRMYIATGANTTEAGLSEMLMRGYCVVAIDEIDFLEPKAMSVLLRFMESGDIVQTKHSRVGEGMRANTMVLGACNTVRRLPPALVSRFYPYHLYFPPYTKEEFIEVCGKLLTEKEGLKDIEVARYIATTLYSTLGHNTDPRAARGLARQLEKGTKEEVDEQIVFLKKRGKYFVNGGIR